MNDDTRATYAIAAGDLTYRTDGDGNTIHQMQRLGARTYTYDANGNLTDWREPCSKSKTVNRQLSWDAENRVTRIAEGTNDTDFRYSAEGARALERGPGGLTWFVNDQWRTVNDGHQYATIFLGGQPFATHRTSAQPAPVQPPACTDTAEVTCVCPPGGACVVVDATQCTSGQLFDPATSTCQPRTARQLYFVHKDLQGSLRVVTDSVGGVFQYADYLPTGRPWVLGQSTIKDTPYLFAGGWTDPTYDMINFGERWFENREQQFYSTEPLLEDDPMAVVDDPRLTSAYSYAASNPLRYVDPSGRKPSPAQSTTAVGASQTAASGGPRRRADRSRPARPSGSRGSPSAAAAASRRPRRTPKFTKAQDKVDKYTTVLSIQTEDGVRTIRVFGRKVSEKDTNAPAPATGASGAAVNQAQGGDAGTAASDSRSRQHPTRQNGAPDPPSAQSTGPAGRCTVVC
jgi:RHS repeat-associated protein